MRPVTDAELAAIQAALNDQMGGSQDWEPDPGYIGVIDHYVSDGPGWSGKLAVFMGGESNIVTVARFQPDGSVELSTMEGA